MAPPSGLLRLRIPLAEHTAMMELGGDRWAKRVLLEALSQAQGKSKK